MKSRQACREIHFSEGFGGVGPVWVGVLPCFGVLVRRLTHGQIGFQGEFATTVDGSLHEINGIGAHLDRYPRPDSVTL